MKYHEPFPVTEGNKDFISEHEKMPYNCGKLIYDKLCEILDALDALNGGIVHNPGLKEELLKLKEGEGDKKNNKSRQKKKPKSNKGKNTQAGKQNNGENTGVRDNKEPKEKGEAGTGV